MKIGLHAEKIFKNDDVQPIYSPRTTYKNIQEADDKLLADLTLNFDKFTINHLKREFQVRDWKIDLPEFICVVREHLTSWESELQNRDAKLVRCLTILFNEIDVNGNGILEWDEFTNYIIQKATVIKNLKSKSQQIKAYTKSNIRPHWKFEAPIPKAVYIPDMHRIAMFEEGSNIVRFMNPETGEFNNKNLVISPKEFVVNISTVRKQKGDEKVHIKKKDIVMKTDVRILDIGYLTGEKYQLFVTSTSDAVVRGWKYVQGGFILASQPDNEQEKVEHQFIQEVYCMAWNPLNEVLYCGLKNGAIAIWNLKTDTQRMISNGDQQTEAEAHDTVIMDMVAMPKLQFLATGGMDGKLILWDTINHKIKWVYREHTRGILTLSFNEALILLFSAGFDHQICIWNPYIPSLIHKIQGHVAPILCVKVIEGTQQVVSLDSEGIVKVSDTRRFNFIASFNIESTQENQKFKPTGFTVVPKPLKLCFTGKSVSIYDYDKNYNPNSVDDSIAICCKYIESSMCLLTPAGNKVKVWSALTGDIDKIFLDVTTWEISAFALDFLKRRMIIGDVHGNVCLYNSHNGAKMKQLCSHNGEVTHLATGMVEADNIFVSAGIDSTIHICKDSLYGYEHPKQIVFEKNISITSLTYCSINFLIIVGTNTGEVYFYESETSKMVGHIEEPRLEEITSLNIMKEPLVLATCMSGKSLLISLPPIAQKYEKFFSYTHYDPDSKNVPLGISNSAFDSQTRSHFLLDQKSYISCYSLQDCYFDRFKKLVEDDENKGAMEQNGKSETTLCKSSRAIASEKGRRNAKRVNKNSLEKVVLLWIIKAHSDIVRSLQFIPGERLLITSSYDRKVVIWNADTGTHLDSLQQNYDKREPKPIAFLRKSTGQIFKPNFVDVVNKNLSKKLVSTRFLRTQDDAKAQQENDGSQNMVFLQQQSGDKKLKSKREEFDINTAKTIQVDNTGHTVEFACTNVINTMKIAKNKGLKKIKRRQYAINFSLESEFDPHHLHKYMDLEKLEHIDSNTQWAIRINYYKHYEQRKKQIDKILEITRKDKWAPNHLILKKKRYLQAQEHQINTTRNCTDSTKRNLLDSTSSENALILQISKIETTNNLHMLEGIRTIREALANTHASGVEGHCKNIETLGDEEEIENFYNNPKAKRDLTQFHKYLPESKVNLETRKNLQTLDSNEKTKCANDEETHEPRSSSKIFRGTQKNGLGSGMITAEKLSCTVRESDGMRSPQGKIYLTKAQKRIFEINVNPFNQKCSIIIIQKGTQLKSVKSKQEILKENEEHSRYLQRLSKRQLKGKNMGLYESKVIVSKQEMDALHKLTRALESVDSDDPRTVRFTKSIAVKQKLPKLM